MPNIERQIVRSLSERKTDEQIYTSNNRNTKWFFPLNTQKFYQLKNCPEIQFIKIFSKKKIHIFSEHFVKTFLKKNENPGYLAIIDKTNFGALKSYFLDKFRTYNFSALHKSLDHFFWGSFENIEKSNSELSIIRLTTRSTIQH